MTDKTNQTNLSISLKGPKEPLKATLLKETPPAELGGSEGPDPTRYGDWQHRGRCTDF